MEFLDKIGLKKFWTKIKTNFGTSFFRTSDEIKDKYGNIDIPFSTNHQIVNIDSKGENKQLINLLEWFKNASEGGIIEIIQTTNVSSNIYCYDRINFFSYLYMMENTENGLILMQRTSITADPNTYLRLIKIDDNKLVVACRINNI